MRRSGLYPALDAATASHRVTLVQGAPRIGRSRLMRNWSGKRDDVVNVPFPGDGGSVGIEIFDHLRREDVDQFVTRVRADEAGETPTRFVVAPVDLDAADAVRTALAGSVLSIDLAPLQIDEILGERSLLSIARGPEPGLVAEPVATNAEAFEAETHWLRGGFPESLSADSDIASLVWRREMIAGLLARNYTAWGVPRAAPLDKIFRWVANQNGGELDETTCPLVTKAELKSVLHVFEKLGLVRRLWNYPVGQSSSFAKKPKLYVRDSGFLHAQLGIETVPQLRRSPNLGDSFEGYAIDALILAAGDAAAAQFYRAKGPDGEDEIDLVLDFASGSGKIVAIECKTSPNASPKPGFYRACENISATHTFVVHSGQTSSTGMSVERLDLLTAIGRIADIAETSPRVSR
jgi:hypothetical protein